MSGRRTGGRIFAALIYLFLYAPIVVLIIFSFNSSSSRTVWSGFSLKWYADLFKNDTIMSSLYTTLMVSLIASAAATVLGTAAAIGFRAMKRSWREPLMTVNSITIMNADIVTGVSLCLLFVAAGGLYSSAAAWCNSSFGTSLKGSFSLGFGTLLIAHITFDVPYVILSVAPKLRQMDGNLLDAAQDLGCTPLQSVVRVVLPEIAPGIVNGALIAFTMSIDDFVISYFTSSATSSTLAMTVYAMTKKHVTPEINAVSTLLFVTVLTLLLIVNIRSAGQEKKRLAALKART